MNKKIKNIVVFLITAIMLFGAVQLSALAADTTAPTLSFYTSAGEIVKSSEVGIYVDDANGVAEIRYYWDYDKGGATEQLLSYQSAPIKRKRVNIQAPSTPGVHILMVRVIGTMGNTTEWVRKPYYVVDSLSATKDTTAPTFILSNEQELPRNNTEVELNRTIKVKAVDQGTPSTGIYFVGDGYKIQVTPKSMKSYGKKIPLQHKYQML